MHQIFKDSYDLSHDVMFLSLVCVCVVTSETIITSQCINSSSYQQHLLVDSKRLKKKWLNCYAEWISLNKQTLMKSVITT